MDGASLDEVDRAILYHLQEDGRRAITDISDAVDVSDNTVRNRIEAMEEAGVIEGYSVDVNYDAANVQHHYVFVCSARVSEREDFAAEARHLPGVVETTTLMTGTHNIYIRGAGMEKDDMTDLAYGVDDLGLTIEREHLVREHESQPYSGFQPPEYISRD